MTTTTSLGRRLVPALLVPDTEPRCGTPPTPVCSGTFYIFPKSVAALAEEFRGKVEFA